ncbi:MAG: ArsR/SmtB family transcription factor [Myxococcota bacterium]
MSDVKNDAQQVDDQDTDAQCEEFVIDTERVARARASMIPEEHVRQVAELFKAFSSETRVRILRALSREELCVCDLAKVLDMTVSAVSHQLRSLRNTGLVEYRKEGKLAYYRACAPELIGLLEDGIRHIGDEGL